MEDIGSLKKDEGSCLQKIIGVTNAMLADGEDVIRLSIGEPNAELAPEIKDAIIGALDDRNINRYPPILGSLSLRRALAEKYGAAEGEVFVSHGAKAVIGILVSALTDAFDDVVIVSPFYPPFLRAIKGLKRTPRVIDLRDTGFRLKAESFISSLPLKAKMVIINSPNNPTGAVYEEKELKAIADHCEREGIILVSDECYAHFSPNPGFSIRDLSKSAIAVHSASKKYAMCGLRIGWAVCPEEVVNQAKLVVDRAVGSPNALSERALLAALRTPGIDDFSAQRELIMSWLDATRIPFVRPEGGIYVFADFSRFIGSNGIKDGFDLAKHILREGRVSLAPGQDYGEYPNHIRICFAEEIGRLLEALERIKGVINKI